MTTGFLGLLAGGVLSLAGVTAGKRQGTQPLKTLAPNTQVVIETPDSMRLEEEERGLLQAIFRRYSRVMLENEFLSGYSGARTFLALPVRADGRADAHTIVKLGPRHAIQAEFSNYETFVKDTLPPVTARIQQPPAALARGGRAGSAVHLHRLSRPEPHQPAPGAAG